MHSDGPVLSATTGSQPSLDELLPRLAEAVLFVSGEDHRIVFANPVARPLLRYEPRDLVGTVFETLLVPARDGTPPSGSALLERVLASGKRGIETSLLRNDETEVRVAMRAARHVHLEYGGIWVVVCLDLDSWQAAEVARQEAEVKLERINDAIADAVFSVGMPQRRIVYCNRAVESLFGYPRAELVGSTTRRFYRSEEDYVEFGRRLRAAFARGEPSVQAEMELVRADGTLWWASISTTFVTSGGVLDEVISVVRDVSEHKQLEHQLLHAQKMEAIGTLAGGVAHDMNNILAVVLGISDLLETQLDVRDPIRRDMSAISTAARRGRDLVKHLLGFARKGKYNVSSFPIDDAVRQVTSIMERLLPKHIRLDVACDAGAAHVMGDEAQLAQAIMNVCLNAKSALEDVPGRASPTLELSTRRLETALRSDDEASFVEVTVRDNGIGMGSETRERVFEPFFTTKGPGQGTGLGMSMVYGVVQNHGGSVAVESEPGSGTVVRLTLPIHSDTRDEDAPGRAGEAPQPRKGLVLVVDDEDLVRAMACRQLRHLGFDVLEADDGAAALQLYRERGASIDLVLLDVAMPGMGGGECLRELRALEPGVRVVVCTGHVEQGEVQAILQAGAEGILHKPFELDELTAALRSVLESGGDDE